MSAKALDDIHAELTLLHSGASELLAEVLHLRPSVGSVLRRKPLDTLEERLDEEFKAFVALDAELIRHSKPPAEFNTAVRFGAQFGVHVAVRDSVRGLLTDAASALASVRSRLDFLGSLVISLLALLTAIIALFVGG